MDSNELSIDNQLIRWVVPQFYSFYTNKCYIFSLFHKKNCNQVMIFNKNIILNILLN